MNILYVITISYFAGILAARALALPLWLSGGAGAALALATFILRGREKFFIAALCLLSFSVSIFMFGVDHLVDTHSTLEEYLINRDDAAKIENLQGTVTRVRTTKTGDTLITLNAERLRTGPDRSIRVGGKVSIIVRDGTGVKPKYGRRWTFECRLKPVRKLKPRQRTHRRLEGYSATAYLLYGGASEPLGRGRVSLLMLAGSRLRERFINALDKWVAAPYNQILGRMLLGKSQEMDKEVSEVFRRAGLAHVLVVSGMHVWFMLGTFLFLSFTWSRRPVVSFFVLASVLLTYFALTGGGASIARATVMGMVFLVALLFGTDYQARSALFFAALALMVMNPLMVFHVGAQLTFLASAGVIFIYPVLASFFPGRAWWSRLLRVLLVSISAQLPIYPIIAYYFNTLCVVSPLSNLVVVPLVGVALPLDLATCVAGLLPGPVALVPAFLAGWVARVMLFATRLFASLPFSNFAVASPTLLWMIFYWTALAVVVVTIARARSDNDRRIMDGILCSGALLAILVFSFLWRPPLGGVRATFIDVGEGDSILVETPLNARGFGVFRLLVDAGGTWGYHEQFFDPGEKSVGNLLKRRGIRHLDAVLLSHHDADHMNGVQWILDNIRVDYLLDTGAHSGIARAILGARSLRDTERARGAEPELSLGQRFRYAKILRTARDGGVKYIPIKAGTTFSLGSGAEIRILSPDEGALKNPDMDVSTNNLSTVARVSYGGGSLLLTGDVEKPAEDRLVKFSGAALKSSLLKSPHHGSFSSSSWDFLEKVGAGTVVISTGGPAFYGHPHRESLERYERAGMQVWRTDVSGTVTCNVSVRGRVKCRPEFRQDAY